MNRAVYDEHYEAVLKYIVYIVNDEQLAYDLLQDTFLKFYRFDFHVQYPRTYLMKIARNCIYDYFRRKRIVQFFTLMRDERVDEKPLPQMVVEQNEENERLYMALQQLPVKLREVITLRYIEEYSVKEAAEILNCNESKVKNDTAKGLKLLREWLKGGEEDGRTKAEIARASASK